MTQRSARRLLKETYAASAQASGRAARRVGLLAETPPLAHRRRHWLASLTSVHDSLAIARLDVPWWTYSAIDAVSSWFDSRQHPLRVFEYGSGASTLWLARRADEVHSVEHHREFGLMMAAELQQYSHVHLNLVEPEPDPSPRVPSGKEDHQGLDFSKYVAAIDAVPGAFDLIVVDGRAREACLGASVSRLAPGGLVVFDNSRRRRYRQSIVESGLAETRYRGLTPTLPYPEQTSLLRTT